MSTMINRHHPITILNQMYTRIRYTIIPLAIFAYREIKAESGGQPYWVYLLAGLIAALFCGWAVIGWYKNTYRMDQETLHLKDGVLTEVQRTIPLANINNVTLEQNGLHRLLGIVKMKLYTADSNASADAELVLVMKKANAMASRLNRDSLVKKRTNKLSRNISSMEIWMLSISTNTFWLGIPFVSTIMQYVWAKLYPDSSEPQAGLMDLFERSLWSELNDGKLPFVLLYVLGFLAASAVLSWLISLFLMQIRYHGWEISRADSFLHIHYGWFNKNAAHIKVDKIQAIRVKKLMLGRLFGYSSVWLDCIGYESGQRQKMLLPAIKDSELTEAVAELLPEFNLTSPEQPLRKGAMLHGMIAPVMVLFVAILMGSYFSLWTLAAMPLFLMIYRYQRYAHLHTKWSFKGNLFILRRAGFNETTVYLKRQATESIHLSHTRLQGRLGIKRLRMVIDSPSRPKEYRIVGISQSDFNEILRWYKNEK
ncbi:PH domain-containing protein [Paenibacillus paridis]|uniref:PH domain-containing protein n=1 Tax=Paenibacillus paridis TaxID=2583376 RepID=UPI00112410BA|nr:PH domain-containing protein [Paenibacillus paridis]